MIEETETGFFCISDVWDQKNFTTKKKKRKEKIRRQDWSNQMRDCDSFFFIYNLHSN